MLRDYRDWLESELKLLGNASHHAYAFGQANMAKRALERFEVDCAAALARENAEPPGDNAQPARDNPGPARDNPEPAASVAAQQAGDRDGP